MPAILVLVWLRVKAHIIGVTALVPTGGCIGLSVSARSAISLQCVDATQTPDWMQMAQANRGHAA